MAIGYKVDNFDKTGYFCGGSLINRWYVLTAAHCFNRQQEPVEVRLGEVDFKEDPDCSGSDCAPPTQIIPIDKVIQHEDFSLAAPTVPNDIALIRLKRPAKLNEAVKLVCLPLRPAAISNAFNVPDLNRGLNGKTVEIIGWGQTNPFDQGELLQFGVSETTLQKAILRVIGERECRRLLVDLPNNHGRVRYSQQICARDRNADTCRGDSGGPLLGKGPGGELLQVGIVSYGPSNCGAGLPGVYTRVEAYMEWIKSNIQP